MRSSSTSLRSLVMPYRLNPRASVTPPFNQQTLRRLVFVPTTDEIFSAGSLNLAMVGPFPREIPRDPTLQVGFVIDLKSHAASAQFHRQFVFAQTRKTDLSGVTGCAGTGLSSLLDVPQNFH
jgi:hypothetical protein